MDFTATQCQVCWRVQGNGVDRSPCAVWWDLQTFIQTHDLTTHDLSFSEGYCPQCTQLYRRLTQDHLHES